MRLLETMRVDDGRVALLDRHLARLAASAVALGFELDADSVRAQVEALATDTGVLRLTLRRDGVADIDAGPLPAAPLTTAWIDPEPFADAGSVRCRHKTTDRGYYRVRWDRARAVGADEAILVNAVGDVTEGTRTTVWVRRGGVWTTPPLAAGGLAGVMRAHLLDTRPDCSVGDVTVDDIRQADAVALSNALRGWMPVGLVDPPRPRGVQNAPSTDLTT